MTAATSVGNRKVHSLKMTHHHDSDDVECDMNTLSISHRAPAAPTMLMAAVIITIWQQCVDVNPLNLHNWSQGFGFPTHTVGFF